MKALQYNSELWECQVVPVSVKIKVMQPQIFACSVSVVTWLNQQFVTAEIRVSQVSLIRNIIHNGQHNFLMYFYKEL